MKATTVYTTLRELVELADDPSTGFTHDMPIYVQDPQREDDGAFPVQLAYDLPVTITHDPNNPYGGRPAILMTIREDFDAVVVHG